MTILEARLLLEADEPAAAEAPEAKAMTDQDKHEFFHKHLAARHQLFVDVCQRNKLTPHALTLLPPRVVRDMILAISPKLAAAPVAKQMEALADGKIEQRAAEFYADSMALKG